MTFNLFIDDRRYPPKNDKNFWIARSSTEAIDILLSQKLLENIDDLHVWFDHDLGGDDTIRPVIISMIENNIIPKSVTVVSSNPVGVDWIVGMSERYFKCPIVN